MVHQNQAHPRWFQKTLIYVSWYSGYDRMDSSGNSHTVTFNEDYAYPLLTEGWSRLREFYNYEGQKQIFLSYLGRNRFLLTLGKTNTTFREFPSYHSLSTKKHRSVFFEIALDELDCAEPRQLVEYIFWNKTKSLRNFILT